MFTAIEKKLSLIILLTVIFVGLISPLPAFARTLDEIQDEIDAKADELSKINSELEKAKSNLNSSTEKKNSVSGSLKSLDAEIKTIEDQLEYNKIRTNFLKESQELKALEKEKREEKQDKQITSAYVTWKATGDYTAAFFSSEDIVKTAAYFNVVTNNEEASIEKLATELNTIKQQYEDFQEEAKELTANESKLREEIRLKKAEIERINAQVIADSQKVSQNANKATQTQSALDQLNQEYKALRDYEEWLLKQNPGGGTQPVLTGEVYFTGRGRDNVQGHGIGYSQNGALGAALAGWNYKQILEFYYPGAQVVKYTGRTSVNVAGVGEMDINTYAAGLGEVPSFGCENLGVSFGEKGYWGCWPKEAIKSQVVASRAYAFSYTAGGGSICTTDACQVYIGGNAKQWAADETSYEVVIYNGQPAKAYYSSNNNQGAGTAHNETVWSTREGNGTPIPYLRSANDNAFYYPATFNGCGVNMIGNGDCSKAMYRTNGYTMAQIQSMFEWSIVSPSTSITAGDRTFLTNVLNNIGTLTNITFQRDGSKRVHKVVVTGTKGSSSMAGWFFKSLWNIWVGNVKPSGQLDYIYSLTYNFCPGGFNQDYCTNNIFK